MLVPGYMDAVKEELPLYPRVLGLQVLLVPVTTSVLTLDLLLAQDLFTPEGLSEIVVRFTNCLWLVVSMALLRPPTSKVYPVTLYDLCALWTHTHKSL